MPKVPSFAKAFAGRWRIVEMDTWDNAFLDLVEEAHLNFTGASDGKIVFGALQGFLSRLLLTVPQMIYSCPPFHLGRVRRHSWGGLCKLA